MINLVGRSIDKLWIDEAKENIKLQSGSDFFLLATHADCCSETWIEHVNGVGVFSPHLGEKPLIMKTEDINIGTVIPTRQEADELYAFKIYVDRGWEKEFAIEFRNSSNGYYGGWLEVEETDGNLEGFSELIEDF